MVLVQRHRAYVRAQNRASCRRMLGELRQGVGLELSGNRKAEEALQVEVHPETYLVVDATGHRWPLWL